MTIYTHFYSVLKRNVCVLAGTVGRLANYNEDLAAAVVSNDILPHLVSVLKDNNRYYKVHLFFTRSLFPWIRLKVAMAVTDT